jgi:hypothetical protein
MKGRKTQVPRRKAPHCGKSRTVGVSRVRAAAIARARVTRDMMECDVYEQLPAG